MERGIDVGLHMLCPEWSHSHFLSVSLSFTLFVFCVFFVLFFKMSV